MSFAPVAAVTAFLNVHHYRKVAATIKICLAPESLFNFARCIDEGATCRIEVDQIAHACGGGLRPGPALDTAGFSSNLTATYPEERRLLILRQLMFLVASWHPTC